MILGMNCFLHGCGKRKSFETELETLRMTQGFWGGLVLHGCGKRKSFEIELGILRSTQGFWGGLVSRMAAGNGKASRLSWVRLG